MVELILQIVTKAANRQQMAVSLGNPVFITAIIVVRLGPDVGEFSSQREVSITKTSISRVILTAKISEIFLFSFEVSNFIVKNIYKC